ncbi:MAG: hypothetical protein V2A79_07360 [Planctomycetota bacterium]
MNRDRIRQYTIRAVPPALDRALRQRARHERKSLNQVALDALRRGAGLQEPQPIFTDLDDCIGTWEDDPAFDAALAGQDRVDRKLWG